ncbi:SDR family NAD(P)-dependent oxidoreductase [Niveispirillum sp.]|uniref:SDR family NAD(P)-dependent oxidoreductase n=1 Tax=Niveispirillum sp. TaxID=1917217 RepID=UPI001B661372|nr:SDR family NAD(P)-dependent oxidoreductase [Niveispirillum sp.]MBP7336866.1 SDR family NAD(P)-dependent oxidoreductase [Niveispirillum sp.]
MTPSSTLFDGRVVIVVGGGQGLGRQYCLDLGAAGARVLVASRSDAALSVAHEIQAAGGTAHGVAVDARDGDAIIQAALMAFGRIDAMIVNAGITRDRSFANMERAEWDEVLDVHLNGAFACARAAWEPMRRQRGGAILFTTSGAGLHGAFGQANYAAAKAGIIGLTRTLAVEGERAGIRVNALAPMAGTAMTDGVFSADLKAGLRVEDVSPFALALIHPECPASGQVIEAGGGWASAMRWERSLGLRLETPDTRTVLSRWSAVMDFGAGSDLPVTTLDCLGAAMGNPRRMRNREREEENV